MKKSITVLCLLTLMAPLFAFGAPEATFPKADRGQVESAVTAQFQDEFSRAEQFLKQRFPKILELNAEIKEHAKKARTTPIPQETLNQLGTRYHLEEKDAVNYFQSQNRIYEVENEQAYDDFENLLDDRLNPQSFNEAPLFTDVVKGKKRIFLWEMGGHAIKENIDEYNKILEAVRTSCDEAAKNKQGKPARILLAAEFMITTSRESLPIQFFDQSKRKGIQMPEAEEYQSAVDTAKANGIDILVLDDQIIEEDSSFYYWKIGDQFLPTLQEKPTAEMHFLFTSSDWGIHQRNVQWAQRISAIEQYYDVVIIWAGNGHYTVKNMLSQNVSDNEILDIMFRKLSLTSQEKALLHTQSNNSSQEINFFIRQSEELAKENPFPLFKQWSTNGIVNSLYIQIP